MTACSISWSLKSKQEAILEVWWWNELKLSVLNALAKEYDDDVVMNEKKKKLNKEICFDFNGWIHVRRPMAKFKNKNNQMKPISWREARQNLRIKHQ